MIRIGILGATGYTAQVLIQLLLRHPHVRIVALGSRREETLLAADVHPGLQGLLDVPIRAESPQSLAGRVDCVFSCLPHAASAEAVSQLIELGISVVDLSADFRFWDATIYEHWYGPHSAPGLLGTLPYGLPELFRDQIARSKAVANPGCYPTSAILAVAPLLRAGVIEKQNIILDAKSGVSGAGRTPSLGTMFAECNESVSAYKVGEHRHAPEIAQILSHAADDDVEILFTPHLIPMDRGILTTGYARATRPLDSAAVVHVLRDAYRQEPFVRVVDRLPATKQTLGTNYCDVTARVVGDHVVTISCLDNLMKGASGAAVQNMNLMFGWDEWLALR